MYITIYENLIPMNIGRIPCMLGFTGFGDEHEYRLTKYLLDGYDAGVRPAKNFSQPLSVVFGLSLHHIIDVVSTETPIQHVEEIFLKH